VWFDADNVFVFVDVVVAVVVFDSFSRIAIIISRVLT